MKIARFAPLLAALLTSYCWADEIVIPPSPVPHTASATARKGSVQLALKIYNTRITRHYGIEKVFDSIRSLKTHNVRVKRAQPVWFQLEIKDVGKDALPTNGMFAKNAARFFERNWEQYNGGRYGTYLVVMGPDGKPEPWKQYPYFHMHGCELPKSMAGFFVVPDFMPHESDAQERKNAVTLSPGQSARTPTWVLPGECPGDRPNPPTPMPSYAELWHFSFDRPGKYTVWAVYDVEPLSKEDMKGFTPDLVKVLGKKLDWQVHFKTPPIAITVLP
ncbi:MAG TPA: hypothetical protein VNH15_05955 [Elusimicrobiota bacterium]|jgi:hypothetical protein|nr:hypothetical protein [Elusimicrobiota bacterium]